MCNMSMHMQHDCQAINIFVTDFHQRKQDLHHIHQTAKTDSKHYVLKWEFETIKTHRRLLLTM